MSSPRHSLRRRAFPRAAAGLPGSSARTALGVTVSAALALSLSPSASAGDILRGGAPSGARATSAGANVANPAVQSKSGAAARDALARTSASLQSLAVMQKAARDAALRGPNNLGFNPAQPTVRLPNVPNGLVAGGLQVVPSGAVYRGAVLPVQGSTTSGQTLVTIRQTSPQALLDWQTFNVGKETTVYFNQSKGTQKDGSNNWIAFNRILDPSGVPSQILGQIRGEGTVYLLNQNGILFGGSAQVNLHSFVASALPINENLLTRGLLNNPDAQFLFTSLALDAGANGTPAFTPAASFRADGRSGDVVVQPGAILSTPTTDAHVGGRVALIGANVQNAGTISTPDGQTILAAGLQVGFAGHTASDPSLRGLDVSVGAVQKGSDPIYAGTATNSGIITAPRASVSLTGRNVNQLGGVESSTSVALNGRIDLNASYNAAPYPQSTSGGSQSQDHAAFLARSTGTVTLGEGSITRILPELDSSETVVGLKLALNSQVNLQGHVIHLAKDASILAPSAAVSLLAGVWKYTGGAIPTDPFVFTGGQIYLDSGATINVAGSTDISAPITENILAVELRGAELADSPLQRTSLFRGLTINVDIRQSGTYDGRTWMGTPLADASGYLGLVQRTVGELTTAGGTVKLNAGNSVVLQSGSKIDVSGGWVNFQEGMVQTSRVVVGGRLLDISQATPDMVYQQIYTGTFTNVRAKYSLTETFANPLALTGAHFEPTYTFGADGGSIAIAAPSMALDGALVGHTVAGPRQRTVAPALSALSLYFQAQQDLAPLYPTYSPTPPKIVFQENAPAAVPAEAFALTAAGEPVALRADRRALVTLSPDLLTASGFGHLTVQNSDGEIVVPANTILETAPGGSLTLDGSNISVFGRINAPGGALSFQSHNISPAVVAALIANPDTAKTPKADPTRGFFTLGGGATLSTAGLLVDDRARGDDPGTEPLVTAGGTIAISAFTADLATGSTLDVSGGVQIATNGRATYGRAGSITIAAGQAAQTSVDSILAGVVGGHLHLGSTLLGFSGVQGGALSILAPSVQIGGATANPDTLLLQPQFFQTGGFSSYTLRGLGEAVAGSADEPLPGVLVADGTRLEPLTVPALAVPEADGTGLRLQAMPSVEGQRAAASLTLTAVGVRDSFTKLPIARGDLVFGEGASIRVDAGGSVTLSGETVTLLGAITAPGGSITVSGGRDSNNVFPNAAQVALPTVYLGAHARLTVAGAIVLTPDARGFRTGSVLGGGSISVAGNIVAATGSSLDASGATGELDLPLAATVTPDDWSDPRFTTAFQGVPLARTRVDSSAGSITLAGGQLLLTDATLRAQAGGDMGFGGSLTVSSGFYHPAGDATLTTPLDVTLTVSANSPRFAALSAPASAVLGKVLLTSAGENLRGQAYLGANRFAEGGFDAISLKGTVRFADSVAISARRELNVADGGVIFAQGDVTLTAPHVAIGTTFRAPFAPQESKNPFLLGATAFNFDPVAGPGTLTVQAQLIDIGNLSLQGISRANFLADGGDIRGNGTLDVAGEILLRSAQVYPPTATTFTIAASDYELNGESRLGSVTIVGSGVGALPLSAGGTLNIYGSKITQGGTLVAPLGTINLGWDGTGTGPTDLISGHTVTSTKLLTLGAGSVTAVSSIDPTTGAALLIPYGLNLNGSSWIDPTGVDVTASGVPGRTVNLAATTLRNLGGSLIDLRGGGDLFAYRFVSGIGGTQDILADSGKFAVIVGYGSNYAPYAPFTTASQTSNLGSDAGYVNSSLRVGDQIQLGGADGLPAGTYTLLPARYALLPGGFLVTPHAATRPVGTLALPDGSSLVAGYRLNDAHADATALQSTFEVARGKVVLQRAEYTLYGANEFLTEGAARNGLSVARLPQDAGHLVLQATAAMTLQGRVSAQAISGGRGGLVDISSPVDIIITGQDSATPAPANTLVLSAADLSQFGAESLLIGGVRTLTGSGANVTVATGKLTVANRGTPLSAPEIILVAKETLTLAAGASIVQEGTLSSGSDALFLGSAATAGSGDGVLIRVSADPNAAITRAGVTTSSTPLLAIGAGAQLSGASLILDSTAATTLAPSANLSSRVISLNSGQISIVLPGATQTPPDGGLVLAGRALQGLEATSRLSLLSYSTLDFYGAGSFTSNGQLSLHADEIRGFGNAGGVVVVKAPTLVLDNRAGGTAQNDGIVSEGTLRFDAETVRLGTNDLSINGFALVDLRARGGVQVQGTGSFSALGDLTITAPLLTGTKAASYAITSAGLLHLAAATTPATVQAGLGASLKLEGASVTADATVSLPSGSLTLRATGGDLSVGGHLSVAGTTQAFYDLTRYTGAGSVTLAADNGSVMITTAGVIDVSAQGAASAGQISIKAPNGSFIANGALVARSGTGGTGGTFALDVSSVAENRLAPLNTILDAGGFTASRSFRLRNGDILVDGTATAHHFSVAADQGGIEVSGIIDASGVTGGSIELAATGNVTLDSGARLTVAGREFDHAGKGGSISLEAGSSSNGFVDPNARLDLQAGASLDLSVAANSAGSAALGDFTGTLHLRAPRLANGSDLQINAVDSTITGASSIIVEGYKLYAPAGGLISSTVRDSVRTDAIAFTGNTDATSARLFANNSTLASLAIIAPGVELINQSGDLTLGTASGNATNDWDLSTFRFGPKGVPGVLTLRAAGDLVFFNSLSDGFASSAYTAQLLGANPGLAANTQSWSYRLAAGADFTGANVLTVNPFSGLGTTGGSILIGKNVGPTTSNSGEAATTAAVIGNRFQVVRTGSGSIDLAAARDIRLRTEFSSIYTAGTRLADPTTVVNPGDFDLPVLVSLGGQGTLGAIQSPLATPQYSYAGGNITLAAGGDITRTTLVGGVAVPDSSRQLPGNWLYRRGYVDPVTGLFGSPGGSSTAAATIASTTWWIDFSNFFEGVGALGGGNVTLTAGHDVSNVDAVIPTNARMAGKSPTGALAPDARNLVELGGGDLTVTAGHDLDAGVYYVERGRGVLNAGNTIHTNATRSPSLGLITSEAPLAEQTWLPTTLFLGKGQFDVMARGDVLLGPVANPFLLPAGVSNTFWLKTYFNTYGADSAVNVASLGGDVTWRTGTTLPNEAAAIPILRTWLQSQNLLVTGQRPSASFYQPWLRLNESQVTAFDTSAGLLPGTLRATAFSGNINLAGDLTLAPSASGTIELAASGAINGLQPTGPTRALITDATVMAWTASTINLSDASPSVLPGVASPFAFQTIAGASASAAQVTPEDLLSFLDASFTETGATSGAASVLQAKQALHDTGLLHSLDAVPARLYAQAGDISGLTFYSAKTARILAGRDLTDLALYIQNNRASDVTVVAAGHDLVAYQPNSPLRLASLAPGNALDFASGTLAGDIQISGPGTIEVLTGRNLDLGIGPSKGDGTGLGLVSIGNARNPSLPFEGADIVAAAGLGSGATSLTSSQLDFSNFLKSVDDPTLTGYLSELAAEGRITALEKLPTSRAGLQALPEELRNLLGLEIFYRVLRDTGRNFPATGSYTSAFDAISALFPTPNPLGGDISLTSREIKTRSGGNISLLAPAGGLTVGFDVAGSQPLDQGILTEAGGNISIFTDRDVTVGTSRIFTLRGGNEIIFSATGDIAAGASSKTVQSAPPTRVLIDAQTADVKTDLAGLATGGGIGVLATVANVAAGDVSLIAPAGTIDAGDAGIRASGNLTIIATTVLNASNIAAGGSSTSSAAAAPAAAPSLASVSTPNTNQNNTAANPAADAARQAATQTSPTEDVPSLYTVEVIGYGGPGTAPGAEDEEEAKRKKAAAAPQ